MSLIYRADPPDGPGVFLVTKNGEQRIAFCPPNLRPTDEQMIRIETSWFTSAHYPTPIAAVHCLRAIGPHAAPVVPRRLADLPPALAFAAMPAVRPWDADL